MFWITMRQYTAERQQASQRSVMRDMAGPLHVSMTTANAANAQESPEIKSKFMSNLGTHVKKFLAKFWIAVVALMLFTSGIFGERMTVFRIVYMSLFLFFVITFQVIAGWCESVGHRLIVYDIYRYLGRSGGKLCTLFG